MKLQAIWKENTYYSKFLLMVGTVLVSTTLFTVLALLVSSYRYGISYDQIEQVIADFSNPVSIDIMKIIQSASSFGIFIVPAWFLALAFSDSTREFLSLRPSTSKTAYLLVMLLILSAVPLINLLATLNEALKLPESLRFLETMMRNSEDQAARITEAFMKMDHPTDLWVNLFVIALLPAVGEELFFRGLLQRVFTGWSKNNHTAIWLTAFLFSAMHAQFYGFIPRMLLGAMLGYLLVWSGSLWLPMLAHFVNNGSAVLFTYLQSKGMVQFNVDAVGTSSQDLWMVLGSTVMVVVLLFLLRKKIFVQPITAIE